MILNINKPKDYTSRDVINVLNKHFKTKKIGHTGTLDPIATGVLIVCTEEDLKLVDLITAKDKEYIATIKLGIATDTLDITGNVLETKEFNVTEAKIKEVLDSFLGISMQEVPAFSAVKVNGRKLYEYARNNEYIELPKREIIVKNIELISFEKDLIKFKVTVSKGTYIRSLIKDICTKLDTVGTMQDLIRSKQGSFDINDSYTLDDILNNNFESISKEEILKDFKYEVVSGEKLKLVKNGAVIEKDFNSEYLLYKDENNKVIAIYTIYDKDESKAKPYKMFINQEFLDS